MIQVVNSVPNPLAVKHVICLNCGVTLSCLQANSLSKVRQDDITLSIR
jgi:hypothetical protein